MDKNDLELCESLRQFIRTVPKHSFESIPGYYGIGFGMDAEPKPGAEKFHILLHLEEALPEEELSKLPKTLRIPTTQGEKEFELRPWVTGRLELQRSL